MREGPVDTDGAIDAWDAALRAPARPGPAVWIHADLQPGNLLMARGRLSAVIDFGCLGVGDPAVDLIAAWYLLPADARGVFRAALDVDDASWARGHGWALSIALDELRYYRTRTRSWQPSHDTSSTKSSPITSAPYDPGPKRHSGGRSLTGPLNAVG